MYQEQRTNKQYKITKHKNDKFAYLDYWILVVGTVFGPSVKEFVSWQNSKFMEGGTHVSLK